MSEYCDSCGLELLPRDHIYECLVEGCGAIVCETCHYDRTEFRPKTVVGKSNCLGVLCPKCNTRAHFNER